MYKKKVTFKCKFLLKNPDLKFCNFFYAKKYLSVSFSWYFDEQLCLLKLIYWNWFKIVMLDFSIFSRSFGFILCLLLSKIFLKNHNLMGIWLIDWFLVFSATFSNISAISWRPVLVVEEAGVPRENHRPWASNW
jgi:hypothetical protein